MNITYQRSWLWFLVAILMVPTAYGQGETILFANFMNGNNDAFNSRVYLWNPSDSPGDVTVRVFTLEGTGSSTLLGSTGAKGNTLIDIARATGAGTFRFPHGALGPVTEIEFRSDGTLFGSTGGGSSNIITINPITGEESLVGMHVFGAVNALEFVNGTLYGVFIPSLSEPSQLVTVDQFTGALTFIGSTGFINVGGLAFDSTTGTMYGGTAGSAGGGNLITIDLVTGAGTLVGATGFNQISALEFAPDGTLYGGTGGSLADAGQLVIINPATGAGTAVGPTGFPVVSGLSFSENIIRLRTHSGKSQELTPTPLFLGILGDRSALNVKLAEDILVPLGISLPYTDDGGNLTLQFTIQATNVRGVAQVFSSDFAFGTYPLQEIPSPSRRRPTVLVANFMNGNDDAFNSRVYLWNPSTRAGDVTVRVFTLERTGLSTLLGMADLGSLEASSARNIKLAEDILFPLAIPLPYTADGGNLTLEFTVGGTVRGVAQVFSSDFAFGTYPLQVIPSTPSGSPTVLVANFVNGNDAALNSRVYLWNPSIRFGQVSVRVFTLPLSGGTAQELTVEPFRLGTLEAQSALNIKLAEDILAPLGITLPYTTDGGNLTLEFTILLADVRGAAQVFSSEFAFGTYPLQEIPSTSSGSPTVLLANFVNGNDAAFDSRVYLFNPSQSAGEVTVRVFTLPLAGGLAQELTTSPLSLGTLGVRSALNLKVAEDILIPLEIPIPYTTDGGNLALEISIQAPDVRGVAQVFSSDFVLGTYPLQIIQ